MRVQAGASLHREGDSCDGTCSAACGGHVLCCVAACGGHVLYCVWEPRAACGSHLLCMWESRALRVGVTWRLQRDGDSGAVRLLPPQRLLDVTVEKCDLLTSRIKSTCICAYTSINYLLDVTVDRCKLLQAQVGVPVQVQRYTYVRV